MTTTFDPTNLATLSVRDAFALRNPCELGSEQWQEWQIGAFYGVLYTGALPPPSLEVFSLAFIEGWEFEVEFKKAKLEQGNKANV